MGLWTLGTRELNGATYQSYLAEAATSARGTKSDSRQRSTEDAVTEDSMLDVSLQDHFRGILDKSEASAPTLADMAADNRAGLRIPPKVGMHDLLTMVSKRSTP